MSENVFVELVDPALDGALPSLLLAPCGNARVDVPADVVGAGRPLLGAQLAVGDPHVVLDADHAAGRPSRRHIASVADRALTRHHASRNCVADVLRVTIHPKVDLAHANRLDRCRFEPP